MRNAPVQKPGPAPSEKPRNKLRTAAPLLEGAMRLSDREILRVISLFGSRSGGIKQEAFLKARDKVRETYGAVLELVGGERMPTKVVARYEFRTADRSLDADLEQFVSGMGFKLTLKKKPREDLPPEDQYVKCSKTMMTQKGIETIVWYERAMDLTYVISEASQTGDVQYAASTAQNFLKLLEMLRPPMEEDMPAQVQADVVDISSARPAPAKPASGQLLAGNALSALRTS